MAYFSNITSHFNAWAIFCATKLWRNESLRPISPKFLLKQSKCLVVTSHSDLPVLKPEKAGLFSNPFVSDMENAPTKLQMVLIELHCSYTIKAKNESAGCAESPHFINSMPQQLKCSPFPPAHTCVSNCSPWWRLK